MLSYNPCATQSYRPKSDERHLTKRLGKASGNPGIVMPHACLTASGAAVRTHLLHQSLGLLHLADVVIVSCFLQFLRLKSLIGVNAFTTGNPFGGKKLEISLGRGLGALKGLRRSLVSEKQLWSGRMLPEKHNKRHFVNSIGDGSMGKSAVCYINIYMTILLGGIRSGAFFPSWPQYALLGTGILG